MSKLLLKSNKDRKKRIPLGAQRIKGILDNLDPAYHYHWINDVPGRLNQALEVGYEFVSKDGVSVGTTGDQNTNLGSMISQYAGRDPSGQPYNRYAMRIRNELYDEDQATKQALVDESDRAMRTGKFKHGIEATKSYIPASGIKIEGRAGN